MNRSARHGHTLGVEALDPSDAELLARAVEGDSEAFGDIFTRHADTVYRYCFRRSASWSDAEELTSITFLEAWRRRAEVRSEAGSLLPWLLGVATNADRNRGRAARRHARLLARLPAADDAPDFADGAADKVDAERRAAQVLVRIPATPCGPRCRRALYVAASQHRGHSTCPVRTRRDGQVPSSPHPPPPGSPHGEPAAMRHHDQQIGNPPWTSTAKSSHRPDSTSPAQNW